MKVIKVLLRDEAREIKIARMNWPGANFSTFLSVRARVTTWKQDVYKLFTANFL